MIRTWARARAMFVLRRTRNPEGGRKPKAGSLAARASRRGPEAGTNPKANPPHPRVAAIDQKCHGDEAADENDRNQMAAANGMRASSEWKHLLTRFWEQTCEGI